MVGVLFFVLDLLGFFFRCTPRDVEEVHVWS